MSSCCLSSRQVKLTINGEAAVNRRMLVQKAVEFCKIFRRKNISAIDEFMCTRMPPVEAALVVTYLQFPIHVCLLSAHRPACHRHCFFVTNSLVVLIIVMIYSTNCISFIWQVHCIAVCSTATGTRSIVAWSLLCWRCMKVIGKVTRRHFPRSILHLRQLWCVKPTSSQVMSQRWQQRSLRKASQTRSYCVSVVPDHCLSVYIVTCACPQLVVCVVFSERMLYVCV